MTTAVTVRFVYSPFRQMVEFTIFTSCFSNTWNISVCILGIAGIFIPKNTVFPVTVTSIFWQVGNGDSICTQSPPPISSTSLPARINQVRTLMYVI
ncbi:hypothetical protein ZOSMA_101G00070 [Zostera marina]|uniref:Uncharacterized protein n=1 Tax=Zostera marina TaxID=29655 RepID=A0A0K9Q5G0_ZOSMR|nr:hypothetical protein ZOSMA_101G00070 [Zostera marina]